MGTLWFQKLTITTVIVFVISKHVDSAMVGSNPYHQVQDLDPQGKYRLEWETDWDTKTVTFKVTVETRGYVGFGLSAKGKMQGADIVIGGVRPNGQVYFSDRHAVGNNLPEVDSSQDWVLHKAWQNRSHTFLTFSRPFDTCDPQDYPITNNKISLLWAYGEKDDELEYHHQNRGTYELYLIGPNYTPPVVRDRLGRITAVVGDKSLSDLKAWTVSNKQTMTSANTMYWCRIHSPPKLGRKHHIVGIEARFPNAQSERHVHHISTHKCHAPPGTTLRTLYQAHVGTPGQSCFMVPQPRGPIPTQYCTEFFWGWGIGGRAFFLPPHVGAPIGESPDEYFLVQIHYDNPNRLENLVIESNFDFLYTANLRPNDAGFLSLRAPSAALTPSILIPPFTIDHHTYAHCGSECTREMLPSSGIFLATGLLHSHYSGVGMRLQHFRHGVELPWILADDNYENTFQEMRTLPQDVRVLPGDQLVLRCTYDNTWTNHTVVAGFTTSQEMCLVGVMYYSKLQEHAQCFSEIESEQYRNYFLGVTNITWSEPDLEFMVDSPQPLAGKTITEVSDNHVDWTLRKRDELRKFHLLHPQVNSCPRLTPSSESAVSIGNAGFIDDESSRPLVSYPIDAKPYRPEETCSFRNTKVGGGQYSSKFH